MRMVCVCVRGCQVVRLPKRRERKASYRSSKQKESNRGKGTASTEGGAGVEEVPKRHALAE